MLGALFPILLRLIKRIVNAMTTNNNIGTTEAEDHSLCSALPVTLMTHLFESKPSVTK